jgi:hypothetical protein
MTDDSKAVGRCVHPLPVAFGTRICAKPALSCEIEGRQSVRRTYLCAEHRMQWQHAGYAVAVVAIIEGEDEL